MNASLATARLRHRAMDARGWLERYRFTLTTLVVLLLAALITETADGSRFAAALSQTGFAPHDVVTLDLFRAVYSAMLTSGGWELVSALGAVALFVGGLEREAGTAIAAATFWGVHLAALLAHAAIAWALHAAGSSLGTAVYLARDVGPSAGYVGCLGALVMTVRPRAISRTLRFMIASALTIGFAAVLAHDAMSGGAVRDISADLAHLVAIMLGLAAGGAMLRARTRPRDSRPS